MDQTFYVRLVLAVLVILGIWNALGKNQILGALGDWMERWSTWLAKPLGLCPSCCASTYGTATWFLTGGDLVYWVPFVLALSGLLALIDRNLLHAN